MSEVDLGWEDVLHRAGRSAPRRRLVFAVVVVIAALGGAPAVAVLLTRAQPPALAMDQIGRNPVHAITDPRVGGVLIEWGKWKGHDGICYLVPRVHADCIVAGTTTQRFAPLPRFIPIHRLHSTTPRLVITHVPWFRIHVLHGGRVELIRS